MSHRWFENLMSNFEVYWTQQSYPRILIIIDVTVAQTYYAMKICDTTLSNYLIYNFQCTFILEINNQSSFRRSSSKTTDAAAMMRAVKCMELIRLKSLEQNLKKLVWSVGFGWEWIDGVQSDEWELKQDQSSMCEVKIYDYEQLQINPNQPAKFVDPDF